MTVFLVCFKMDSLEFYLRGKGVCFNPDDADDFPTEEKAREALNAAAPNLRTIVVENVTIEEFL